MSSKKKKKFFLVTFTELTLLPNSLCSNNSKTSFFTLYTPHFIL